MTARPGVFPVVVVLVGVGLVVVVVGVLVVVVGVPGVAGAVTVTGWLVPSG